MRNVHCLFPSVMPLCLAAALVAMAGCTQDQPDTIRFGVNPWPGDEYLFVAQGKGLFREEGVNVDFVYLTSQGDLRRAFERGQIDVMSATNAELLMIAENTRRIAQAFYVLDYSNGADAMFAPPAIRSVADPRGKRIGIETGTLDVIRVHYALKSAGLAFSDVTLVPTAQSNIPRAFAEGEIDAAYSYPPYSTQLPPEVQANRLFDSSQAPYAIVDVLAGDPAFLKEHRGAMLEVQRELIRSAWLTAALLLFVVGSGVWLVYVLLNRYVLRPAAEVEAAMHRRAAGDSAAYARIGADGEIGRLAYLLNQMLDVVAERDARLQRVIEGSEVGYWDLHVQTGRVVYGGRWAGMLGYRSDELEPSLDAWEGSSIPTTNRHWSRRSRITCAAARSGCRPNTGCGPDPADGSGYW